MRLGVATGPKTVVQAPTSQREEDDKENDK